MIQFPFKVKSETFFSVQRNLPLILLQFLESDMEITRSLKPWQNASASYFSIF